PRNSDVISMPTEPPLNGASKTFSGVSFQPRQTFISVLYNTPMPNPPKMSCAPRFRPRPAASAALASAFADSDAAAFDSSDAPALSTSAQAVPSGYFNTPCSFTINARRSGIIINIPSAPPRIATSITRDNSRSKPRIMIGGIVTPTPNAIDSPADPAVCTMLFSRIVASRPPNLDHILNRATEITATG